MYGYFSEGTHNLLVTEDGFETVSYLNVECPIMNYYGMWNVSHSKYTSDTYGCILIGMTLTKGSTDTNPYIMKDGWEHCEWVKQGIPECENNGMVQCRDLYAVDGVDTTFYIAAEDGFVYKSAMIPVNGVEEKALQIYVYPNPVEPDFTGMIKIANLMEDTYVTVTDGEGHVMAQIGPVSGRLLWDGSGTDGERLPMGLYNIFVAQGGQPVTTGAPNATVLIIK